MKFKKRAEVFIGIRQRVFPITKRKCVVTQSRCKMVIEKLLPKVSGM